MVKLSDKIKNNPRIIKEILRFEPTDETFDLFPLKMDFEQKIEIILSLHIAFNIAFLNEIEQTICFINSERTSYLVLIYQDKKSIKIDKFIFKKKEIKSKQSISWELLANIAAKSSNIEIDIYSILKF